MEISIFLVKKLKHSVEDALPRSGCHDAASSITCATRIVMIHAQVVAHLVSHHSGGVFQVVAAEL